MYVGLSILLVLLLADCHLQAAAIEHRLLEVAIVAFAALAGFLWIAVNARALARNDDEALFADKPAIELKGRSN